MLANTLLCHRIHDIHIYSQLTSITSSHLGFFFKFSSENRLCFHNPGNGRRQSQSHILNDVVVGLVGIFNQKSVGMVDCLSAQGLNDVYRCFARCDDDDVDDYDDGDEEDDKVFKGNDEIFSI